MVDVEKNKEDTQVTLTRKTRKKENKEKNKEKPRANMHCGSARKRD